MMMFDVTALGETLIDFTEAGVSADTGMALFARNPGGAPANVAAAVSRLGGASAFIGRVGDDMHGRFLIDTLRAIGVDTQGVQVDPDAFTTLAFVSLSPSGERAFSFARKPGADTRLTEADLPEQVLEGSRILHFGSLSLTDEPARTATHTAVRRARAAGAIIAYDPNDRPLLWRDRAQARDAMRAVLPAVDVIKLSDEETALLTDAADPAEAAARLTAQGVGCVVVTLGAQGALVRTAADGRTVTVPGFRAKVVDTTGAGDSFWGGFLYCLARSGKRPQALTSDEAAQFARFGNAVAALNVSGRGAIPAMPTMEAVNAKLAEQA